MFGDFKFSGPSQQNNPLKSINDPVTFNVQEEEKSSSRIKEL